MTSQAILVIGSILPEELFGAADFFDKYEKIISDNESDEFFQIIYDCVAGQYAVAGHILGTLEVDYGDGLNNISIDKTMLQLEEIRQRVDVEIGRLFGYELVRPPKLMIVEHNV